MDGKSIVINCDSQAALQAIDGNTIKSNTTLNVVQILNTLAGNNQVLIRWIPAHNGFEGNEKADELAKRGASGTDSTVLDLPTPRATWNAALRERTTNNVSKKWRSVPPSHFSGVWRDKFTIPISNFNRSNLRKVTMFLTGHSTLNYTLNKYKPDKFSKICPHCLAEEETIAHFIGRCPS